MILVTGGSGLVGKHLKDILPEATYISSMNYDLTVITKFRTIIDFYRPEVIIH